MVAEADPSERNSASRTPAGATPPVEPGDPVIRAYGRVAQAIPADGDPLGGRVRDADRRVEAECLAAQPDDEPVGGRADAVAAQPGLPRRRANGGAPGAGEHHLDRDRQ